MELEHEFTVPVPVEQAWPVLLDIERVAPCMPGATLDSVEGDQFTGRLRVKVGPVTVTYRGTAGFSHKDEQSHTATIEGSGKEARGSGTASATVRAQLHEEGESTRVTVHTNLQVTGRPAQFGRNVMSEVGAKLIGKFADCLAGQLAGTQEGASATAGADASATTSGGTGASGGAGGATTGAGEAASAPSPATAPTSSVTGTQSAAATSPNGSGEAATDGQQGTRTSAHAEAPPHPRPSPTPTAPPEGEAINLFDVAGGPVLRRALPAAGALLAILAVVLGVRRKRGNRRGRRSRR